jgi:hypothetical protein
MPVVPGGDLMKRRIAFVVIGLVILSLLGLSLRIV